MNEDFPPYPPPFPVKIDSSWSEKWKEPDPNPLQQLTMFLNNLGVKYLDAPLTIKVAQEMIENPQDYQLTNRQVQTLQELLFQATDYLNLKEITDEEL